MITKYGPPEARKGEMREKYGQHKRYNHDSTSCQRMVMIIIYTYVVRLEQF